MQDKKNDPTEKKETKVEQPVGEEKQAPKLEKDEQKKVKELQDQMLRLRADFENTKKRLERDRTEAIKFANEKLLVEILPIADHLDQAMICLSGGHDPEKVNQGLKIAQEDLHKILERHGVGMVESLGKEFDPQFHEAVGTVESTNQIKEGFVADEIQRGYVLNGRLIRPSRVRVAQKQTEQN
jgi:molecular chaperone GrpE